MFPWKGGRTSPGGIEWYNYPSVLAQEYWYHVRCLGRAWLKQGYRHGHGTEADFLLHYVRRGEFWYQMRGQEYRATAGTLCLMGLSEPVQYGNDRRAKAEVWWVQFNSREMPHMFTELRADRDPLFDHLDTRAVEDLFRKLFELIRIQPPAYEPKSAAAVSAMVAELFASRAKTRDFVNLVGRTTVLSEPVRRGIDYITRFYATALPLKQICEVVDQSMYHFARSFHREVGVPPIQYLNRYRIEQAKRLLASSDDSIARIRLMVGIPSPVHFSRLFRRFAGTSPLEYRAKTKRRDMDKPLAAPDSRREATVSSMPGR